MSIGVQNSTSTTEKREDCLKHVVSHTWLSYHPVTDDTHWTVGSEKNFVKQYELTGEFEARPLEPRA